MVDKSYLQNPSYSALLSLDNGMSTGSGFCFNNDNDIYLVTAKHVLFTKENTMRCQVLNATFQNLKGGQQNAEIWEIDIATAKLHYSPNADIALIIIGKKNGNNIEFSACVTKVQAGNFDLLQLEITKSRRLEEIGVVNTVYLMGYPTSLLFSEISASIPLFRKGIIAGFDIQNNVFVVDCPAYYGNSGSPILEECEDGQFRFCGVASRYIPFVVEWRNPREPSISNTEYFNSGYSICTPVDELTKLIELSKQG